MSFEFFGRYVLLAFERKQSRNTRINQLFLVLGKETLKKKQQQ